MKCDEVKPECGRCVKAKVKCPGPRTPAEKKAARTESSSSLAKTTYSTTSVVSKQTPPTIITVQEEETAPELDFNILQAITIGMHGSQIEGHTLDRFIQRIVPCMGIFFDANFFTQWILPATQKDEQVFNAALAVTAFHDLPMADIWTVNMPPKRYERYQNALDWYRKSLNQSMQAPPNKDSVHSLLVGLLTISLYLGIELR